MAKESGAKGKKDILDDVGIKAGEGIGTIAGKPCYVKPDGSVCFGDDCLTIKPQEDGKLVLQIRPSQCGEATGKLLFEYLVKTAGKGVVIEIPSETVEK